MLSNLPVAEALSARTSIPAAQTTDAKAGTPGQSFFDVFAKESDPRLTGAPDPQSAAQGEPSVDSTPKGAEVPETSETAGLPSDTTKPGAALGTPGMLGSLATKPHAPQAPGTPEDIADQTDTPSKSMDLPAAAPSYKTGHGDTAAPSDPRSDLGRRPEVDPRSGASGLSPQPHQSGVSDTGIGAKNSGTQMSPAIEKIALSAQEQVFLNTNRPSSDGQQIVHPANATSQPILRQINDHPVAPQISALVSKTPMMQEQATASMGQAGKTRQAPTEAGAVIKGAPVSGAAHAIGMPARPTQGVMQPAAPSHSVPSDSDKSVIQETLGKPTAKTSNTSVAAQPIAAEPKARPTHAPLSEVGKQVRPGGSQPASSHTLISPQGGAEVDQNMPVPQARMAPTESETKGVSNLSQYQPKGSVTETTRPTPVAVSKADRAADSDAPFTARQSEVPVQQGAVNPSASGLKTAMSNTNMHISPAVSQGISTSALLHDAELAVDDPAVDLARPSEQVSFGTSVSEAPMASAARPEMIRSIAAQMVAAAPRGMQAPVEIALNPEELGQVKMSVTTTDTSVVMTIAAERPETLELMRRNLEQLTSEFRDLGYSDINFVFTGDGSESANNSEGSHDNQSGSSAEQEQVALTEKQTPSATSSGVDVRV